MNIHTPASPKSLLLSYQDRYSMDLSRYKCGMFARQTGKDFTSGEEGVSDIYEKEIAGERCDWLIVAPSERQSIESLEKWKTWQEAYELAVADIVEEREGGRSEGLLKKKEIHFPNGSRAIAVPGKPETVRGFSANVLETEAAFFEDEAATDAALFPTITNPLAGLKKIRKISTPNGRQGRFFNIVDKFRKDGQGEQIHEAQNGARKAALPEHIREKIADALDAAEQAGHETKGLDEASAQMNWSVHVVTIYDAVAEGLPVNIAELYAGLGDPEAWAQEFECQFLDTALVYYPYDLLAACETEQATVTVDPEFYQAKSQFPRFWGWDFARSRDKSVFWVADLVGELLLTREVHVMENTPTPAQVEQVRHRVAGCDRGAIDYTGAGIGAGDYLAEMFGEWKPAADKFGKVELVNFSAAFKLAAFPQFKMAMEQRAIGLPINRAVRESFHSIHRVVTAHGNVSFRAPHTNDGHADEATAGILCNHAARQGTTADYRMIQI